MSMLCWGLSQQVILLKTKYMVEALIIFFITLVISVLKYKILIDVHMYLKLSENKYQSLNTQCTSTICSTK